MEEGEIKHRTVMANGIRMHVAEKGEGPVVLLLHGFPELWYSWRHQIHGLAALGYHAVAPDFRGYGDTEAPPNPSSYSIFHIVADLISLIDSLSQDQVFVVGHDWGAMVAWDLCTLKPDKVKALVNLSVMYSPRNPNQKPLDFYMNVFGEDHYICRFQEHGVAEAEFARVGTRLLLKKLFSYHQPAPHVFPKGKALGGSPHKDFELPPWLSEEDIQYYATKFEKSGFTGALNYYRCMNLNWELMAPWTRFPIKLPVKFIVGDLDLTYQIPGVKNYIHKGHYKRDVPFLQDLVIMEGVGHFINQVKPNEITNHIYEFISKF
ncbi:epoxide hydrolase A-like [Dioscorea cayenensis subsp. rotundata]|uniref:soluble epoxide hydrolase n=1 Tax=Dioscorea cayennensis subsp. rotundata TaxID=55577 RepID=A0AB40C9R0_DIOCR|nr:epoxide hydrolase A-like [Dioscorea cayenensis subsp. rotundata]